MSNNSSMTMNNNTSSVSSSVIIVLNIIQSQVLIHLPIIFTIIGLIGFIGNAITFLQPALRSNTFCLYSFFGSVADVLCILSNLLPNYVIGRLGIAPISAKGSLACKLYIFFLGFLPQLSINLLLLSLIDQFARTCDLRSRIRRLNQIKMVPWMIGLTIIFTCLTAIRAIILYDLVPNIGCISFYPLENSVLYIIFNGLLQPVLMFIFVLLTYRNIIQSRRRVLVNVRDGNRQRNQFIRVTFIQILTTGCLALPWIITYAYSLLSKSNPKSAEQAAIELFAFFLTNYIYYLNNVKSFFLCTMSSRLFRKTFIEVFLKLSHQYRQTQQQRSLANTVFLIGQA